MEQKKHYFACFGDSITSDQVTGIGTRVAELLNYELTGNFAVGFATGSDWHEGDENITPLSLEEPPNTNTADNVLSNQIRRCLKATESGAPAPDVIYIAIGINDGNRPENAVIDDTDRVLAAKYEELTRCSLASALRWGIETLRASYPTARMFIAPPLYTGGSSHKHMERPAVLLKRDITRRVAEFESVSFIDSTFESGFSEQIALLNGKIHPNAVWKEEIAKYVASRIRGSVF